MKNLWIFKCYTKDYLFLNHYNFFSDFIIFFWYLTKISFKKIFFISPFDGWATTWQLGPVLDPTRGNSTNRFHTNFSFSMSSRAFTHLWKFGFRTSSTCIFRLWNNLNTAKEANSCINSIGNLSQDLSAKIPSGIPVRESSGALSSIRYEIYSSVLPEISRKKITDLQLLHGFYFRNSSKDFFENSLMESFRNFPKKSFGNPKKIFQEIFQNSSRYYLMYSLRNLFRNTFKNCFKNFSKQELLHEFHRE